MKIRKTNISLIYTNIYKYIGYSPKIESPIFFIVGKQQLGCRATLTTAHFASESYLHFLEFLEKRHFKTKKSSMKRFVLVKRSSYELRVGLKLKPIQLSFKWLFTQLSRCFLRWVINARNGGGRCRKNPEVFLGFVPKQSEAEKNPARVVLLGPSTKG